MGRWACSFADIVSGCPKSVHSQPEKTTDISQCDSAEGRGFPPATKNMVPATFIGK